MAKRPLETDVPNADVTEPIQKKVKDGEVPTSSAPSTEELVALFDREMKHPAYLEYLQAAYGEDWTLEGFLESAAEVSKKPFDTFALFLSEISSFIKAWQDDKAKGLLLDPRLYPTDAQGQAVLARLEAIEKELGISDIRDIIFHKDLVSLELK